MTEFFADNWGTLLIGILVAGTIAAITAGIIRDKRRGKCSGCSHCCGAGESDCSGKSK